MQPLAKWKHLISAGVPGLCPYTVGVFEQTPEYSIWYDTVPAGVHEAGVCSVVIQRNAVLPCIRRSHSHRAALPICVSFTQEVYSWWLSPVFPRTALIVPSLDSHSATCLPAVSRKRRCMPPLLCTQYWRPTVMLA